MPHCRRCRPVTHTHTCIHSCSSPRLTSNRRDPHLKSTNRTDSALKILLYLDLGLRCQRSSGCCVLVVENMLSKTFPTYLPAGSVFPLAGQMTATTWNLDVRCGALLKRNKCLVTQRTSAAGKMGAPSTVEPPTRCPLPSALLFFFFLLLCGAHPKTARAFLTCRERHRHHPVQALCVVACLIWLGFIEGAPLLRSVTDLFVFPPPATRNPHLRLV